MIRIAQFGEGNFLRTFVDTYFEDLNRAGGDYAVTVIKPRPGPLSPAFAAQNNRYHAVLRGMQDGVVRETVCPVSVIDRSFSLTDDRAAFDALACDPALRIIVSNTTEAGIRFCENDTPDAPDNGTFPAKLTTLLYRRFSAGGRGVYLLPTELIDNNADTLLSCVERYIALWGLPDAFAAWNRTENVYCNTLVDRIVSGYPRDAETRSQLTAHIGTEDALLSVGEPFGLWAIEDKGGITALLPAGHHNIDVVLCEDIGYYKKRKVRILNGSHTNLVPAALCSGCETVYDCMQNTAVHTFFRRALEEIIPFVSPDTALTRAFADDTEQRFCNPFLNHRLESIALNSISKWRTRVLPTFSDYYTANGCIPPTLTVGFAYLCHLYLTQTDTRADDPAVLAFFRGQPSVDAILANTTLWGEDLTQYDGLSEAVAAHLAHIANGGSLL